MAKAVVKNYRMNSSDGSIYIVQETQLIITVQALGGKQCIAGEKRYKLLDGTPVHKDKNGFLVVEPNGPRLLWAGKTSENT